MSAPPVRLVADSAVAAIDVERGGRLASWSIGGRELLVGPPTPEDRSIGWGCFLMAPWAGRLAAGRVRAGDGRLVQLPRTHGRNAIHGLVWDRSWTLAPSGQDWAELRCSLPRDVWPPGGDVRHEIRLDPDRLEMVATVHNPPSAPFAMPAAIGWHPWFRRDGQVALRVDAAEVLETDRMIPTGATLPVSGSTDLRRGPRLGRRRLDHAYVDARSPTTLRREDLELTIGFEPSPATVVVYTPSTSLCVEPQTAWPNAPALEGEARRRSGLRLLAPGESLVARMWIAVRRVPG